MTTERTPDAEAPARRVDRKPHLVHVVGGEGYLAFRVECLAGTDPDRACRAGDDCLVRLVVDDQSGEPEMLHLPEDWPITGPVPVLPLIIDSDDEVEVELHLWSERPWTPNEKQTRRDGSTFETVRVKTVCTACGAQLGDTTAAEVEAAIAGRPLGDTSGGCPYCRHDAPGRRPTDG